MQIIILSFAQYFYNMKKDILLDAATVAGCTIGVGFLSGKEAQLFFGSFTNVLIFALCFFALNMLVRTFCRAHCCFDVNSLSKCCFGRFSALFTALFLLCSFVCVVTILAGVENCLNDYFPTKIPLYGILVAFLAALILKRGLNALKILNVVSIALALVFLLAVALTKDHVAATDVAPSQPIKYALFSVTMSLGVLAPLANTTKKSNVAATVIATLLISLLIVFVLCIGDFSLDRPIFGKSDNAFLNVLGGVTVILATSTGVAANTLPIAQCIGDVFQDDTLCYTTVFCLALALSMFGFDFALAYGYMFVAAVGILTTAMLAIQTAKNLKKHTPLLHKEKNP